MKVEVGNAREEDIEFILEGIKEICRIEKQKPALNGVLLKQIRDSIRNKKIRVAKLSEATVGFLYFSFSNKEPYGLDYGKYERRFAWVEWMYVHKNFRRRGIGTSLYSNLKELCKKKKIREIMLDVFEVNKNAQKFYNKNRFKPFIHIMREEL